MDARDLRGRKWDAHSNFKVSVVIPALNEADNLKYVLPRFPSWTYEVILVDGRSTDGTPEVARQLMPEIRIVTQKGKGKGDAIRCGFDEARGDIVVVLDADGSMDPTELPTFVGALISGADFVKGSRFVQGAGTRDMTQLRRIGNWGLVTLSNILFGTQFTDITYGYNACWRQHRRFLALEIDGWAQEIITNIRVARAGLRVVEAPSVEFERIAGEAKLQTFSAGWTILVAILSERFQPAERAPNGHWYSQLRGMQLEIQRVTSIGSMRPDSSDMVERSAD